MNVEKYLERIQFTNTPIHPDYITLEELVECHLRHIPFENIDIQHRIPIRLHTGSFYEKVIVKRRGGYCYELNGLFCELLRQLGYNVSMLSGRVVNRQKTYGAEYDHMALLVDIDGVQWLVDVGFGDFSVRPLAMLINEIQSDGRNQYRITDNIEVNGTMYHGVEQMNARNDRFNLQYIFTLHSHTLSDYEERNNYQQTSPDSHFTQNYICSLLTVDGRLSIVNNRLYQTVGNTKTFSRIKNEDHRRHILQEHFGISPVLEPAT